MATISDVIRKPAVKIVTRLVLYGLAALFAKLGPVSYTHLTLPTN